MAGLGATDLQDLAQSLLDAAVEALDTIPDYDATLEGAPDRQFISPGIPVDDCDQIAVYTAPIIEGPTAPLLMGAGTRHRQDFRVNQVGLFVRVTRCCLPQPAAVGAGIGPPAADLTAAAAQLNADIWALWNHVWNLARAGDVFTLCGEVFFDGLTAFPPSGQCGGCVLSLRVSLEGYEEVLP